MRNFLCSVGLPHFETCSTYHDKAHVAWNSKTCCSSHIKLQLLCSLNCKESLFLSSKCFLFFWCMFRVKLELSNASSELLCQCLHWLDLLHRLHRLHSHAWHCNQHWHLEHGGERSKWGCSDHLGWLFDAWVDPKILGFWWWWWTRSWLLKKDCFLLSVTLNSIIPAQGQVHFTGKPRFLHHMFRPHSECLYCLISTQERANWRTSTVGFWGGESLFLSAFMDFSLGFHWFAISLGVHGVWCFSNSLIRSFWVGQQWLGGKSLIGSSIIQRLL